MVQTLFKGVSILSLKEGVSAVTFEELEDLFFAIEIEASAAAFHGFLCGRLSGGAVEMPDLVTSSSEWLALSPEQSEAAEHPLTDFYQASLSNLEDLITDANDSLNQDNSKGLEIGKELIKLFSICSFTVAFKNSNCLVKTILSISFKITSMAYSE